MNSQNIKQQSDLNQISLDAIQNPWKLSKDEILNKLSVDPERGLNSSEIETRRKKFGSNKMMKKEQKNTLEILGNQFKSIIVLLLLIATIISFIFGEIIEGIAIGVVIIINTMIGFFTELKAIRSMESLYELTKIQTKVKRGNEIKTTLADNLVIGDIVQLDAGDLVPADLRIIESSKLQANESSLTGESVPVDKDENRLEDDDIPLAERRNMLFNGTAITRGSSQGVVIAVGENSELGRISTLVQEAGEGETPLTKRLQKLGRTLFLITLVVAVFVAITGIFRNKDLFLMIETAIALAIATVPEGLPIVATISLARGMWRMAKKNALINRLSAVETLGETNIICTDKTGTLTENRMTAIKLFLNNKIVEITGRGLEKEGEFLIDGEKLEEFDFLSRVLIVSVLCNNASFKIEKKDIDVKSIGDPLEVALLVMSAKKGYSRKNLLEQFPEVREESFDPTINMMATINEFDDGYLVSVKGAPENVLDASESYRLDNTTKELDKETRSTILEKNEEFANDGLRIIAVANKEVQSQDIDPYSNLIFLGLIALLDPARKEVKPAIEKCMTAGIKVIMITGDQAATARYIGKELGIITDDTSNVKEGKDLKPYDDLSEGELEEILNARIFARVSPEQKLDLVDTYQKEGSIVAMTGDGVNDAPALRKANIGIAMGKRGTQVAQEAADVILEDDNFATITTAVEEGRIILENIKKFVIYLLSCNISEILLLFFASIFNMPLPLLPLQILFLNIVTDIFPAFALTAGKGSPGIMNNPPRDPKEPIITKQNWISTMLYGLLLTSTVLGTFSIALYILKVEAARAITISFVTLAFVQLWHVLNMRNLGTKLLQNDVIRNKLIWGAIALSIILVLIATYMPGLSLVLSTTDPQFDGWLLILSMSSIPLILGQIWKSFGQKLHF